MNINTTTTQLKVVITGKDGITKIVSLNELANIMAQSGDKFQIIQTQNGQEQIVDNFIVIKNGKNLELSFANGETLSIENFYNYNNIEMEFSAAENSTYTLSSKSADGHELSDGTTLVYAQGEESLLLSMAGTNDSLHTALSNQISVTSSDMFAAAEGVVVESGTVLGMSTQTAAFVIGGVMVAGTVASIESNSSGKAPSKKSGNFYDSAVEGADYYINGVKAGTTDVDGKFEYSEGDTVTFKIGNIELGDIDTNNMPEDGKVTPMELAGLARNVEASESVTKILQLLQTLDSDGDPDNGITITRDTKVLDAILGKELKNIQDESVTIEDVINTEELKKEAENNPGMKSEIVSKDEAKEHLSESLEKLEKLATADNSFDITAQPLFEFDNEKYEYEFEGVKESHYWYDDNFTVINMPSLKAGAEISDTWYSSFGIEEGSDTIKITDINKNGKPDYEDEGSTLEFTIDVPYLATFNETKPADVYQVELHHKIIKNDISKAEWFEGYSPYDGIENATELKDYLLTEEDAAVYFHVYSSSPEESTPPYVVSLNDDGTLDVKRWKEEDGIQKLTREESLEETNLTGSWTLAEGFLTIELSNGAIKQYGMNNDGEFSLRELEAIGTVYTQTLYYGSGLKTKEDFVKLLEELELQTITSEAELEIALQNDNITELNLGHKEDADGDWNSIWDISNLEIPSNITSIKFEYVEKLTLNSTQIELIDNNENLWNYTVSDYENLKTDNISVKEATILKNATNYDYENTKYSIEDTAEAILAQLDNSNNNHYDHTLSSASSVTAKVSDGADANLAALNDKNIYNLVISFEDDSAVTLDLSTLSNDTSDLGLTSIDAINGQNDTINLTASDILDMGYNLKIYAESGDTINLNAGGDTSGWTKTEGELGGMDSYYNPTHSYATIMIAQEATVDFTQVQSGIAVD